MELRAVPAQKVPAPLAVLVPIGATPLLAFRAICQDPTTLGPVVALLVLAGGLAAAAIAGRADYGVRVSIGTAVSGPAHGGRPGDAELLRDVA